MTASSTTDSYKSTVFIDPKCLAVNLIHNIQRETGGKAVGRTFCTGRCFGGSHWTQDPSRCPASSQSRSLGLKGAGISQQQGADPLAQDAHREQRPWGGSTAPPGLPRGVGATSWGRGLVAPSCPTPDGKCSSEKKKVSLRRRWELHFPVRDRLQQAAPYRDVALSCPLPAPDR